MKIIIADCAISLVPDEWKTDKKISEYINKYKKKPLINASDHQHLMQKFPKYRDLGRPDILHFGLLTCLGYFGILDHIELEFFVDNDNWYQISKGTKLPRSQKRFYGLLEQLLEGKYEGSRFIRKKDQIITPNKTILFSNKGRDFLNSDFNAKNFVFGGFSHGNFKSFNISEYECVRLSRDSLDLWTAMSLFINKYIQFHEYKT